MVAVLLAPEPAGPAAAVAADVAAELWLSAGLHIVPE